MTPPRIRPVEAEVRISPCRARLPFRFGIHTMTAAPLATCHLVVEFAGGGLASGFSSDLLVPKWFEKDPDTPIAQDWMRLIESQRRAIECLLDGGHARPDTVFAHWRRVYADRVESASDNSPDLLLRGQGVSLVERAMIDAVCRHTPATLAEAVRGGLLGFDSGALDPALSEWTAARLPAPSRRMSLRHTVGLIDALEPSDLTSATRVNDGLPESLYEDTRTYGLTHFKIKVAGGSEEQLDRLARVWSVISRELGARARVTLDGNEQFGSIAEVLDLLQRIGADPRFRGFAPALLLIEQPLHRALTFDPGANRELDALTRIAPCIIDEADAQFRSLPAAVALGYRGVSIKSCKGVFRALASRARCDLAGTRLIQSAEDLTTLPVVSLQQDLALASLLGCVHVERNGHHYFRGLLHVPPDELGWALQRHSDLYDDATDPATLRIAHGELALDSVVDARGFGYAGPVDLLRRIAADSWDPASLARSSQEPRP